MTMPVYLDYNATTPIAPEVAEAIRPCLEPLFGNPSSPHLYGIEARRAVETARAQVAELLGCAPSEVIFTGGGTEANNMALKGVARAADATRRRRIVTSAVEHPAILEPLEALAAEGVEVVILPVDGHGLVDPDAVRRAVQEPTLLVSVMHANSEVGTIQPIADIASIAHEGRRADAFRRRADPGKAPVRVDALGSTCCRWPRTSSTPPRVWGALCGQGVHLAKYMHGATHEANRRAGTENLIGIVGLARPPPSSPRPGGAYRSPARAARCVTGRAADR